MPLNIRAGTIEVLKGPNGESVPKIMDSRTALPSRASQTDPAEPTCRKYVARATDSVLCRAPKQRSGCLWAGGRFGGVMWHSDSAHYKSTDAEGPTGTFRTWRRRTWRIPSDEIYILAIQCKAFADPQTGDNK